MAADSDGTVDAPVSLRRRLFEELEPTARQRPGLSPINRFLVAAILLAASLAVLETEPVLTQGRESTFRTAEIAFALLFAAEYLARLWTSVEAPHFAGKAFPRLRYALTRTALIDLAAIIPTLLSLAGGSALLLRFFRVFRLLRLAKLGRMSSAWRLVSEAMYSRRFELGLTGALAALAMLVSATLLYLAEGEVQPDKFGSIPRALWWAVMTLTTVGYGDVYPVTVAGKLFTSLTALSGIALIALPTGILAAAFSDAVQRHRGRYD